MADGSFATVGRAMGDEKPTAKVDQTEVIKGLFQHLERTMTSGMASLREDVSGLDTKVELLRTDARDANQRLARLEGWRDEIDGRVKNHSDATRLGSQANLEQDAAIATVLTMAEDAKKEAVEARAEAKSAKEEATSAKEEATRAKEEAKQAKDE